MTEVLTGSTFAEGGVGEGPKDRPLPLTRRAMSIYYRWQANEGNEQQQKTLEQIAQLSEAESRGLRRFQDNLVRCRAHPKWRDISEGLQHGVPQSLIDRLGHGLDLKASPNDIARACGAAGQSPSLGIEDKLDKLLAAVQGVSQPKVKISRGLPSKVEAQIHGNEAAREEKFLADAEAVILNKGLHKQRFVTRIERRAAAQEACCPERVIEEVLDRLRATETPTDEVEAVSQDETMEATETVEPIANPASPASPASPTHSPDPTEPEFCLSAEGLCRERLTKELLSRDLPPALKIELAAAGGCGVSNIERIASKMRKEYDIERIASKMRKEYDIKLPRKSKSRNGVGDQVTDYLLQRVAGGLDVMKELPGGMKREIASTFGCSDTLIRQKLAILRNKAREAIGHSPEPPAAATPASPAPAERLAKALTQPAGNIEAAMYHQSVLREMPPLVEPQDQGLALDLAAGQMVETDNLSPARRHAILTRAVALTELAQL